MRTFIYFLLNHREVFGIATGAIGVSKTIYDFIQSRSPASTQDKLLLRIQGLEAALQAMNRDRLAGAQPSIDSADAIRLKLQLSEALSELTRISPGTQEKPLSEGNLSPFQLLGTAEGKPIVQGNLGIFRRAFLIYKPQSTRAWVAHIICWVLAFFFPFYILGVSLPDGDDGTPSLTIFARNWNDPNTWYGLVFFLGIFLLARSGAIWERGAHLQNQPTIATSRSGLRPTTAAALLYALVGAGAIVGEFAVFPDGPRFWGFALFGIVVLGCGLTLYSWGKLGESKSPLTTKKAILLLLLPTVLMLVIIFDIDGIVVKQYQNDILGYWRNWVDDPLVPALLIPFSALPLFAGVRCLLFVGKLENPI